MTLFIKSLESAFNEVKRCLLYLLQMVCFSFEIHLKQGFKITSGDSWIKIKDVDVLFF